MKKKKKKNKNSETKQFIGLYSIERMKNKKKMFKYIKAFKWKKIRYPNELMKLFTK